MPQPDDLDMAARALVPAGFDMAPVEHGPQVDAYLSVALAMRQLQSALAAARPSPELSVDIASQLSSLSLVLEEQRVDEERRLCGRQWTVPGRAQFLSPPVEWVEVAAEHRVARIRFDDFYLGGHGAAHGGAISLVFDEFLGAIANGNGRGRSRTAYLHVDYRAVVPVGRDLTIAARLTSLDRRKILVTGELSDGDRLLAEANGLFVTLLPGQP